MPATNGHVPQLAHPYPALVNTEPLPGRSQDEFRAEFEVFLGRLSSLLTVEQYQLAYAAGREMWRACWWAGQRARAAEVRQEMGENVTTLPEVRREYVAADVEQLG